MRGRIIARNPAGAGPAFALAAVAVALLTAPRTFGQQPPFLGPRPDALGPRPGALAQQAPGLVPIGEPSGSAAIGPINPLRDEGGPRVGVTGGQEPEGNGAAASASFTTPAGETGPAASSAPATPPAGDLSPSAIPAAPALTPLDIQQRREELSKVEGLEAALKTQIEGFYAQAAKDVDAAAQDVSLAASYEKESSAVAAKTEALGQEVAAFAADPSYPLVPDDPGDANLESLVEQAKQEFAAATARQAELQGEPTRRATRRTEIPKEQTDLATELEEARAELAAYTGDGEAPALAVARRTALQAAVQRLAATQRKLEREAAFYSATASLLPLQQDLAARRTQFAEKQASILSELLTQRMHKEVRELADKAEETSESLPEELQPIVDRLKIRAERSAELVNRIDVIRELQKKIESNTERWERDYARVREKLELVGMSQGMGLLLQQTRRRMTNEVVEISRPAEGGATRTPAADADAEGEPRLLDEPSEILDSRQQLILDARLDLMTLEDERARLADPQARAANLVDAVLLARQGHFSMPEEVLLEKTRELLVQDREQLNLLIKYQASYFEELVELDTIEQANGQLIDEYKAFIDERILWTPSATTASLFDATSYADAVAWLSDRDVWLDAFERWRRDVFRGPWIEIAFVITFIAQLLYHRRLRGMLGKWAETASRPTCQTIRPTALALIATGLLAMIWAWPGIFGAMRLLTLSRPSELTLALGRACFAIAWWSFFVQFLRHLLRNRGLADAHFFWTGTSRKRLRSYVLTFYPLTATLVFLIVMLHVQDDERLQNGPGRALSIALLAILAFYCHLAFRPSGPWANRTSSAGSGPWQYRLRWFTWAVTTLSPATLAILSFIGYHYTAMQLAGGFVQTVIMLSGLALARATIARWMLLHRRRLAFQQARARLQNAGAEGTAESRTMEQMGIAPPVERQSLDLHQLSEQGRRFVGVLLTFSACVGLLVIWREVLPALNLLNQVVLLEDDAGVSARDVTLLSVALALASGIFTIVAIRNVPGLMELFILPRLPLDAGARYAVTTLTRYALIVAGVVAVGYLVGLQWSQYQWLVGAAAVGLGFGLQEIFANFVSGLILLFERPIRVGDVVTVEGVTGVVSKIRMRATTVTNWDNQEFIVPNKDFVTGKLLNWTLTNSRNRVVIPIGISYDDDPDVARSVLLAAADEMEFVMKDPAPSATFEGFEESSLKLVLRCHLDSLDHRQDVIHELHSAINRKFKEAKLTIPFPQRDLRFVTPMTVRQDAAETSPPNSALAVSGESKPRMTKAS